MSYKSKQFQQKDRRHYLSQGASGTEYTIIVGDMEKIHETQGRTRKGKYK